MKNSGEAKATEETEHNVTTEAPAASSPINDSTGDVVI